MVVSLQMMNNSFTQVVPSELGRLTGMSEGSLASNRLCSDLPTEVRDRLVAFGCPLYHMYPPLP